MKFKYEVTLLLIVLLLVISTIIYVAIYKYPDNNTFEMPNGIGCDNIHVTRTGYVFSNCEDGSNYINPETFKTNKQLVGI